MKFLNILIAVLLLSGIGFSQVDHSAMSASTMKVRGAAIPDWRVQRVALLLMVPDDSDSDVVKIAKHNSRMELGVNEAQLLQFLAIWSTSDTANENSYNAAAAALNSASLPPKIPDGYVNRGPDPVAQAALEQQAKSQSKVAIAAFLANLNSKQTGAFNTAVQRLKTYSQLDTNPNPAATPASFVAAGAVSNLMRISAKKATAHLQRVDETETYTDNGYLYTSTIGVADPYFLNTVTITGHYSFPTWTCTWDSYHGEWQPYPGCSLCGGGVPCHTPSVTANVNSVSNTNTGSGVAPNVDVNVVAYAWAVISLPASPLPSSSPSGNVWCSAGNNYTSSSSNLNTEFSTVDARAQNDGPIALDSAICYVHMVLCSVGPYVYELTVRTPGNDSSYCNMSYYGDTYSLCVRPPGQTFWTPENCLELYDEPHPYTGYPGTKECDTAPKS